MTTIWREDSTLDPAQVQAFQYEENAFHACLRAFFWELKSALDLMKIWISESYGRKSALWEKLEESRESNWYKEVTAYRNFSHESFLVPQGLYQTATKKLIARNIAQAGREGGGQPMIPDTLIEYRNETHALFATLLTLVPPTPMPKSDISLGVTEA
jgi:hypothetical protein